MGKITHIIMRIHYYEHVKRLRLKLYYCLTLTKCVLQLVMIPNINNNNTQNTSIIN